MAQGLGIAFEEIAAAAGLKVLKACKVPIISWAAAPNWREAIKYPAGWVAVISSSAELFALKVHTSSLAPEIAKGDTLIVDPRREPSPGSLVLVVNGIGEVSVKMLAFQGEQEILQPLNQKNWKIEYKEKYKIIGVISQKIKIY